MHERRSAVSALLLALAILALPISSAVAGLAAPTGRTILSVTGQIEHANQDGAAVFDRAMIEALGMETIVTETPWTEGPVTFEGVSGARLLDVLGEHGSDVLATAINDYTVEIPAADFRERDLFIALRMNGRDLRVRDKGPIWIVYPFSSRPDLNSAVYYNRSIWQLRRLEFK